jgi:hypothetical protein
VKAHNLTRRQLLGGGTIIGASGLTLAGLGGYAWPHPAAAATTNGAVPVAAPTPDDARGVLHFVSRPDLTPPALTITHHARAANTTDPPYFILTPSGYPLTGPGTPGLMILDRHGGIVWYSPNTGFPASKGMGRVDLKVQSYRGKPVLTWWEGQIDDGGARPTKEPQSRAILLDLDTGAMRAVLRRSYVHAAGLAAANQGSMQGLADGQVLVGWGNLPYFSQFTADGTLILDGQFPVGDQSYRAFTAAWTADPTDQPAAAARVNPAGGSVVYASWNGATEVKTWTVLAGKTADALAKVGAQQRSGFETMVTVNSAGPFFAVTAQDAGGHVLGQSATVPVASS